MVVVDPRPPLSLTSDKSTECYRNWWPDSEMTAFVNRSIDLLEALARETGNRFHMNRRGYLFATGSGEGAGALEEEGARGVVLGAGPLRVHRAGRGGGYAPSSPEGWESPLTGADLLLGRALVRERFPWLSPETRAVLHVRRAGWLSAQQLGMTLLEGLRERGGRLLRGEVTGLETEGGRLAGVRVALEGAEGAREARVRTPVLVNAAGPFAARVGALGGEALPVVCEPHVKLALDDPARAFDRGAPLTIWNDPVMLPWSPGERALLAADPEGRPLLEPFPAGVHGRPEGGLGGSRILLYWTRHAEVMAEPVFPIEWDPRTPELTLRAMAVVIPGLERYFERMEKPWVDGGYYAKAPDNRPLVGPLGTPGVFACTAFSGFGIMAAMGAGELLAAHVRGDPLPPWGAAFLPSRLRDPDYLARAARGAGSGQL